ncbi:MAG: hypothetical protein IJ583_08675, partial [Firmicutes bacterium]|nr:hypothetical protein [Bacillota bacterium]
QSTTQQNNQQQNAKTFIDIRNDGGLTANFDDTEEGTGGGSGITIAEGQYLSIDSSLTAGKVQVTVTSGGSDINEDPTKDSGKMPTIDYEFESIGVTDYYEIEPGDYMVFVKVNEKASGKIDFIINTKEESQESSDTTEANENKSADNSGALKENKEEATHQIELAMQKELEKIYEGSITESKVYVEKIYSAADEAQVDAIKEMNLGKNEVAFELAYELKPAEGADINLLTVPDGEYDEKSGWVKNIHRLGILRPESDGNGYIITNLGTGW